MEYYSTIKKEWNNPICSIVDTPMKTNKTFYNQHPQKDVLFIIADWNAKVGSQETPRVTENLALECGMKQGKD